MEGSLLATLQKGRPMTDFVVTTGGEECELMYADTVVVV